MAPSLKEKHEACRIGIEICFCSVLDVSLKGKRAPVMFSNIALEMWRMNMKKKNVSLEVHQMIYLIVLNNSNRKYLIMMVQRNEKDG